MDDDRYGPYVEDLEWPTGLTPLKNEDDGSLAEPYEQYAWLREHAPVARMSAGTEDVWLITRYDDVREAARDHELFSSQMSDGEQPTFITLFDRPYHTHIRRAYAAAFNRKSIALVEDTVTNRAESLVDDILARGRGDIVKHVCVPLTMATIGGILGVPTDDASQLKFWSDQLLVWHARNRGLPSTEESALHTAEFFAYLEERLGQLYEIDSESVGGHLARQWKKGTISAKEAREMAAFLFMAGHDTTTFLLGNGFRVLAEDPSLLSRMRTNPQDAGMFVEELARFRSAVHRIHRRTTQDVDVAGVTIPEGSLVRLVLAAANRDTAVFKNPDVFDMDRDHSKHLGFGFGVHSCIGAPLARLEARVLFQVLAERAKSVEVADEDGLVLTPGHAVTQGPTSLELTLVSN